MLYCKLNYKTFFFVSKIVILFSFKMTPNNCNNSIWQFFTQFQIGSVKRAGEDDFTCMHEVRKCSILSYSSPNSRLSSFPSVAYLLYTLLARYLLGKSTHNQRSVEIFSISANFAKRLQTFGNNSASWILRHQHLSTRLLQLPTTLLFPTCTTSLLVDCSILSFGKPNNRLFCSSFLLFLV